MKKIAIFFAVLFVLIFVFSELRSRKTTFSKSVKMEISASPEETKKQAVERAYKASFDKGYKAFLSQNGFESRAIYQYTSNVQEVPVREEVIQSEEYKDAVDRGYVDGYHRATEISHCPRPYYDEKYDGHTN